MYYNGLSTEQLKNFMPIVRHFLGVVCVIQRLALSEALRGNHTVHQQLV